MISGSRFVRGCRQGRGGACRGATAPTQPEHGALRTFAIHDCDSTTNPSLRPLRISCIRPTWTPAPFEFDSANHAYFVEAQLTNFVEAQLTKSRSSANPGLMAVQICNPAGACEEN